MPEILRSAHGVLQFPGRATRRHSRLVSYGFSDVIRVYKIAESRVFFFFYIYFLNRSPGDQFKGKCEPNTRREGAATGADVQINLAEVTPLLNAKPLNGNDTTIVNL